MADKRNVVIDFLVNDRKAKQAIKGVGDQAQKSQSKFSQLSGGTKALVGGFAAIAATKVVSFLGDAAQAALEDQRAQTLLKVAMQNTAGATDDQVAAAEEWIDTTQRQTGIADDELRPALANLVRATGDVEEAQTLMGTAMDIATARGLPLEAVSLAITKAINGNVGAMGRLGLKVKDETGRFLTFEEAVAAANEQMGGATDAAADTAEGAMRRFSIAADEAKESLGELVVEGIGRAFTGAQRLGNLFDQTVTGNIEDFEITTGQTADTLADAVAINQMYGRSFEELFAAMDLTAEAFVPLTDAEKDHLETLGYTTEQVDALSELMAKQLVQSTEDARTHGIEPLTDAQDDLTEATDYVSEALREQLDAQKALTDPLFALIDATNNAKEAEQDYVEAVAEAGPGSKDAIEAGLDLAEAQQRVNNAALTYAEEGGPDSVDAIADLLEQAGLMPDAIQAIIDVILELNRTPVKNIRIGSGTLISDEIRGARASGGPVAAGSTYVVGERGPELLTMGASQNGYVTANGKMGASYNIGPIYASGTQQGQLAGKAIVEAIRDYEKRNGKSWRGSG